MVRRGNISSCKSKSRWRAWKLLTSLLVLKEYLFMNPVGSLSNKAGKTS